MGSSGRIPLLASLALGLALVPAPAHADVEITMDAATLNVLLSAVAVYNVDVPLGADSAISVALDQAQVVGFDPATGPDDRGSIRTTVRLRAPQIGLTLRAEPRLSLRVV